MDELEYCQENRRSPVLSDILPSDATTAHWLAAAPVDELCVSEFSSKLALSPNQMQILADRVLLRQFFLSCDFPQPQGVHSKDFAPLSAWVVKHQIFPLVMKLRKNSSGMENTFRVQGFREFPFFFERLQTPHSGDIMLEEWIEGTTLELTLLPGGSTLIAQSGLFSQFRVQPAWRMFPAVLPPRLQTAVTTILDRLSAFRPSSTPLLRITIVIREGIVYPVAIGICSNRLEYFRQWNGINADLLDPDCKSPFATAGKKLFRLEFIHQGRSKRFFPGKRPDFGTVTTKLENYWSNGRHAVALFSGNTPKALKEAGLLFRQKLTVADDDSDNDNDDNDDTRRDRVVSSRFSS